MNAAALVERWPLVGRWEMLESCAAVLASGERDGMVIAGPAGVGKTRLAEECRLAASDEGWTTVRAIASRTAATAPLGALAHLLPPDVDRAEPGTRFAAVAETMRAEPDVRRLWVIDDAHLLDAASLILLSQLVTSGLVFLVATIRTDARLPDGLSALVRSERVVRLDLPLLERDDVATLLHLALGGPVDASTANVVWNATLGNVLFARELVHGSRASGALVERDGVWMLDGPPSTTPGLADHVGDRIAALDDGARRFLEALASVESVGLDHAVALASSDTVAALEDQELIHVVVDGRRRTIVLAHPLYGEVLRGATSTLRSQIVQREMAEHVIALGARRREDALRIASWQLAAGARADGELLLRAARVARYAHDFEQTEQLARAAIREQATIDARIVLGEALFELGRFHDADDVLADTTDANPTDDDIAAVATIRSTNTFWGLLDPDAALTIRREARGRVHDPAAAAVLRGGEAAVLVFSGRPRAALELLGPPVPDDGIRARVARAIAEAPALALVGRIDDAVAAAQQGFADHIALGDAVAVTNPGAHLVAQVLALTEGGRLDAALELATPIHDAATEQGIPIARIWATLNLARIALVQGRLATARRWFAEAAAIAAATGYLGPRRLALAGLAMVCAQLGDASAAVAAADELVAAPGDFPFLRGEQALGRAWAAVACNEPAAARSLLIDAADVAAADGELTSESWLLHDLARLGAPVGEARLAALAASSDSELVAARAAHLHALVAKDGAALAAASESFERLGTVLLAAEAAATASNAFRAAGDQRRAASASERSAALAARCEGARTPGLMVADVIVALSARELDVARLAAAGLTSKEISERLFIAARTVDNHLQRVFTKLGVTRRAELADALDRRGSQA